MVAPGAGLCGVTLFRSKIREDQKKKTKGLRRKITRFLVQMRLETKQNEKKLGLRRKSVELWFYIIIWCHPKMVSSRAWRRPWLNVSSTRMWPKKNSIKSH